MKVRKAAIKAIKSYLPPNKLTNEQLAAEMPGIDINKVFDNTGVRERSIAAPEECTSDLGVIAAQQIISTGICLPEEIDFLLFCTQNPDYFIPASACIMQERLGLSSSCGALDFNLGCSGFVYGLSLAKGLIETDMANNVLLIVGDTLSKTINPRDRSARPLFSDGASATLISKMESEKELIGPFVFGTDGRGAKNLIIPAGGFRIRPTPETALESVDSSGNFRSAQQLFMDGAEIFNFSLATVPKAVGKLLAKSNSPMEEIDYFIFHQANKFMLETLRRKIKIPPQKFCINMDRVGNTSSATIPMALETGLEQGIIQKGATVLVAGFGVGYSWAAALLTII